MKPNMSFAAVARHCEMQTQKSWLIDIKAAMGEVNDPSNPFLVARKMGIDPSHRPDMSVFRKQFDIVVDNESTLKQDTFTHEGQEYKLPSFLNAVVH